MISLRDGMGSGWDGKIFRHRCHRRRRPLKLRFLVSGFLRDRIENERSRRDTTAILIVWMLRFFLKLIIVLKKALFLSGSLPG